MEYNQFKLLLLPILILFYLTPYTDDLQKVQRLLIS